MSRVSQLLNIQTALNRPLPGHFPSESDFGSPVSTSIEFSGSESETDTETGDSDDKTTRARLDPLNIDDSPLTATTDMSLITPGTEYGVNFANGKRVYFAEEEIDATPRKCYDESSTATDLKNYNDVEVAAHLEEGYTEAEIHAVPSSRPVEVDAVPKVTHIGISASPYYTHTAVDATPEYVDAGCAAPGVEYAQKEAATESDETTAFKLNELYFLDSVVFLVGGQLFRVPRYCFLNEAGATFHKLFSHPFGKFDIVKGSSIRHPLPLPKDVSAFDFESFLKVMYPLYSPLPIQMNRVEWESALRLATKWKFTMIRRKALSELSKMDLKPIDYIDLGTKYACSTFLVDGYKKLALREESVNDYEASVMSRSGSMGRFVRLRDLVKVTTAGRTVADEHVHREFREELVQDDGYRNR